ncbi:MAG: hypothetical protein Q4D68_02235 [Moraxella equi]|nr:hypothetical protein [Moraxella equi]
MIIEISTLPTIVQQAMIQGRQIDFADNGKIIAHAIQGKKEPDDNMTLYEWAMMYDGVDVADIEIDEVIISK